MSASVFRYFTVTKFCYDLECKNPRNFPLCIFFSVNLTKLSTVFLKPQIRRGRRERAPAEPRPARGGRDDAQGAPGEGQATQGKLIQI